MKNFYYRFLLLLCLVLPAGLTSGQFSMKDNTVIGQSLLTDEGTGISTFTVHFNTTKDSSYWTYIDSTGIYTITLNKCQTQKGLQVNVYPDASSASAVINGDFECRDYGSNRNPVRVKNLASLVEILDKFKIKNAGTGDSLKNVPWKPAACLFDLDEQGTNQAFGAFPGMYKRVEYGFQYNFSGVLVTADDISFEIDTYGLGNTGKQASYTLTVATGSATNIIATVNDFYVTGSGKKTVKLAEAIGKVPADFSNQKVYFFLKTLGTDALMAETSVDPVIVLDNMTVSFKKPSWIAPAAGVTANAILNNAKDPVAGSLGKENLFAIHFQTSGRLGAFTITNDRAFHATKLFTFLAEGAVKAKDSLGKYTVDVPYTFTAGSETVKEKIVIAAPAAGAVDDDLMFYLKATPTSTSPVTNRLELDCGTRIWYDFYFRGATLVGYFTKQKSMDATASAVTADPVLLMLQSDANLEVTLHVLTDVSVTAEADLTGYDVVVIQESLGGGDKILTPAGALGLGKLIRPVVYNKTFAFKTGRALTAGGSATGAEEPGLYSITADSASQHHGLFRGIPFTNDAVALFKTGSDDLGKTGTSTKALNYATGLEISASGTLLALPAGITATPTLSFNDIPAGTLVGGEQVPSRMIALGMNFGAMCAAHGTNITAAGLTLWRNAVYLAAGLEVPETLFDLSSSLDTLYSSAGKLAPAFSGSKMAYMLNLPSGTGSVSFTAVPSVAGSRVDLPGAVTLSDGEDRQVKVVAWNILGNDSAEYTIDIHVATDDEILFVGGSNDVPLNSTSSLVQDRKTVAMLKEAGYSVTFVYKWGVTKSYIGYDFDFTPYKAVVFGASAPSDGTKSYAQAGYPIPAVNLQKDGGRYNKWGWVANQAAQYAEKKITAIAEADRVKGLKMHITDNTHYITAAFAQDEEVTWCSSTPDSVDFGKIVLPGYNLADSIPEAIPLATYVGGTAGLFNLWAIPPGVKVKSLQADNSYAETEIPNRIVMLSVQSDAMLYPAESFKTLLIRSLEWALGQMPKRVGYFTKQKSMDATASAVTADPVLLMLQSDANLEVTLHVLTDVSVTAEADLTGYDVVVIQESLGGGDKILTPAGALGLGKLIRPVVYNKTFAFKTGRALTAGGSATGAEEPGLYSITADSASQHHGLFRGIPFTNDAVALFKTGSDDLGKTGTSTKALNYATGLEISASGTLLALPAGITATPTLSFNDIPAGTLVGGEQVPSRMIALGMNFGAMCAAHGTNITAAGLTLWRNAVYLAAGLEVPETLFDNSSALDTLFASVGDLSPSFAGDITEYRLVLSPGTTSVSLTAVPEVEGVRVVIPGPVALADGDDKTVSVICHSRLGNDSTVYNVAIHVATTTAEKVELQNEILVYPIPATNYVRVRFSLPEPGSAKLSLYDLSGRQIVAGANLNYDRGTSEIEMNTQHLKEGLYIYRLDTRQKTWIGKLQVSK